LTDRVTAKRTTRTSAKSALTAGTLKATPFPLEILKKGNPYSLNIWPAHPAKIFGKIL